MTALRDRLQSGRPLLFDGAMGTYFAARYGEGRCELADLDRSEAVRTIHRAYLDAGCEAIRTNTFSVSADLAGGEEDLSRSLIQAGCRLALETAAPYGAYVFADIGPAPEGKALDRGAVYSRQAELFLDQGITCFLAETLPSDEGIADLAAELKARCPEAFLLVSFAVGHDGVTREGLAGGELLRRTAAIPGVDAVGFNCVSGPQHLLEYIQTLDLTGITLSVMPNAGYPTVLGRRIAFQGTPTYFGQKLSQIGAAGAAIVGGCCGTTPDHIARAAEALARPPVQAPPRPRVTTQRREEPEEGPFSRKLRQGERVIAVELDPPPDDDGAAFLAGVRALRAAGADAVTIADCPVGRPRADSSILACKLKRELGVEPLPHLTCRDRNLNATKALLLGLSMEGVHNVLLVTGDPIPTENRDEVKGVFNFNSRKLARYVAGLNETVLKTPFRIFGALNVNARNFEIQLRMACEKEACGVDGFLTQPVLSPEALENLELARATLKGKLLGGIYPPVSHRNACFLNNEIAGIRVSEEILSLYEGKDRQEAEDLAVELAVRIASDIAPYTDGLYLMTPFQRIGLMTRILSRVR